MVTINNKILDICDVESPAIKFSKELSKSDVIFLRGDLGAGKTTFVRFVIKNLYLLNNKIINENIVSPTYPILLTYNLKSFEIYHYDFYRIKNVKDIEELDFFENIQDSITFVEWPEILMRLPFKQKHYIIDFDLHSENKRVVNIKYFE